MAPIPTAEQRHALGLNTAEAAARLNLHPMTLRDWVKAGKAPPSYLLCGRRYFPEDAFDAWLRERQGAAS